jgi:hypothetical protein
MFGGVFCETILFIVLLYVPGINGVFGGRRLDFFLLGIPGLLFSMTFSAGNKSENCSSTWITTTVLPTGGLETSCGDHLFILFILCNLIYSMNPLFAK